MRATALALSRAVLLLTALTALVGAGLAPPTADASGCRGSATSQSAEGLPLDTAAAPGAGGTVADPFDVSWDGPIAWSGTTASAIENGTWTVGIEPAAGGITAKLFSLAVASLAHGDVGNQSGTKTASGTARLSDYLPVRAVAGTYTVTWDVSSPQVACTGSVVIAVDGNPLTTPVFLLAVLLILLGGWAVIPLLRMLVMSTKGGAS